MRAIAFLNGISKYVPESAARYCTELWLLYPFKIKIKKKRRTVLGDYTFKDGMDIITVNGDMNRYAFMITYLHEIAHLVTHKRHGWNVKPHGEEWKTAFKELIYPVLKEDVFPPNVIPPLYDYIADPAATSCSDIDLLKALGEHDLEKKIFLSDVKIDETFRFDKVIYRKIEVKRTRALCRSELDMKMYYIPLAAQVEVFQLTMF